MFWPFLWGDVFSFAFWPYGYYEPFWAFGPTFILASIFAPGPYFGLEYGYGPDYYPYEYGGYAYEPNYYGYDGYANLYGYYGGSRRHIARANPADREALAETNEEAVQSCSSLAPGVTDLPIDQIREAVHPTSDQEAALDDLSAAMTRANDVIKASCPATVPLTPIGRLEAVQQRLEAIIKAIPIVRTPLEKFYDSLSDEQRQHFNAMAVATKEGQQSRSTSSANDLTALCGRQSGGFANLSVQRIEQVVQPDPQQQSAFDSLKRTTESAVDSLQSSCPTAIPRSPMARLDTAEARLHALSDAIKSIHPALENFYTSLSDEQKARFNMMGPPPKTNSSQR